VLWPGPVVAISPLGGYNQFRWDYESGKAGIEAYLQTKIVWLRCSCRYHRRGDELMPHCPA
jgi:hypothetical protein